MGPPRDSKGMRWTRTVHFSRVCAMVERRDSQCQSRRQMSEKAGAKTIPSVGGRHVLPSAHCAFPPTVLESKKYTLCIHNIGTVSSSVPCIILQCFSLRSMTSSPFLTLTQCTHHCVGDGGEALLLRGRQPQRPHPPQVGGRDGEAEVDLLLVGGCNEESTKRGI